MSVYVTTWIILCYQSSARLSAVASLQVPLYADKYVAAVLRSVRCMIWNFFEEIRAQNTATFLPLLCTCEHGWAGSALYVSFPDTHRFLTADSSVQ